MSSNDEPTKTSNSASSLVSTLVPTAAVAGVFVVLFILLRSKYKRIYRPRTHLEVLHEHEKTKEIPNGKFSWIRPFQGIPDDFLVNHMSLDGYLYLRYFKMLTVICFVGCCITWPVLFPVNATGNGGKEQLDLLTFANIGKSQKNRYYAHTFTAWIFFAFVMYIITRETIYFINLRHAYLLTSMHAQKLSSRTILFTFVPSEYLNTEKLRELFGSSMRRAWLATDCDKLEDDIKEQDKVTLKLENAEIKLSKLANNRRLKSEKKAAKAAKKNKTPAPVAAAMTPGSEPHHADQEAGTPHSEWIVKKDRPTHRLGKIPLIGKKVDTIEWARTELGQSVPQIEREQNVHRAGEAKLVSAVFVEFTTQLAAENAFRRMSPHRAPHMAPRAIGVIPSQIVWKNLGMGKAQRKSRSIIVAAFLSAMILYWAIPVAVVGAISNINYLTDKVKFLGFINDIPDVILGVVTGLLPAVALSILMALVPIVCRLASRWSGEVTFRDVELKCQNWYFAFQVVNVFLITTFASGAAAVVTSIVKEPNTATTLLAENLPLASNFYIAYIILQGLGIAAGNLLNIGSLVGFLILGKFLDKSPRKMFNRYITLAGLGWGSLYPRFTCLGVIALAYACIAPLVLGFATIGFALIYIATRYNTFFVVTNNVDTQGRAYAKALQQLFVGLYIAEVCLIGLFAINTAPGPIVLMAVFLGATAVYHSIIRHALEPLTIYLPASLDGDDRLELFKTSHHGKYDATSADAPPSTYDKIPDHKVNKLSDKRISFFSRAFDPRKFKSFAAVKRLVPTSATPQTEAQFAEQQQAHAQGQALAAGQAPPQYDEWEEKNAYFNPAIAAEPPRLWLVRDSMGISQRECVENERIADGRVRCSDELSWFNDKGKVEWAPERVREAPLWEKRVDY